MEEQKGSKESSSWSQSWNENPQPQSKS